MDLLDTKFVDIKIEGMKVKIEADLIEPALALVFGQLKALAQKTDISWDDELVVKMEAAVRAALAEKVA